MRGIALFSLQVGAWLSLIFGLLACINSFARVQETSEPGASVVGRFIFEAFPLLLVGVIVWAFLLLAVEGFEQIATIYKRSGQ